MNTDPSLVLALRRQQAAMIDEIAALVGCESPSNDLDALGRCADLVAEMAAPYLGCAPERLDLDGRPALRWAFSAEPGAPRLLLLGHLDTVWPLGSLATHPYELVDGRLRGPGCFDMKAGLVQVLHALACLERLDGVTVLVTSDEEIGSPSSRPLIEQEARLAAAALVAEPSVGGAVKDQRKGVSLYQLEVLGRAAHAGLEPEKGANATVELAHQILALATLGHAGAGTTVTPTLMAGGSTTNTVPARASVAVDARAATTAEQARVDRAVRALRPALEGTRLQISGGPNRPPLDRAASAGLLALARQVAEGLGLGHLDAAGVGGGSDGNFTAGVGTPTLDGLGPVGGRPPRTDGAAGRPGSPDPGRRV
jgi:glutamate carboxypeptidase